MKHLIKISEDVELNINIPDIMDLEDFYSLTQIITTLTNEIKCRKESAPSKGKAEDIEGIYKEYQSLPWGQKHLVAKKYGMDIATLRWKIMYHKEKMGREHKRQEEPQIQPEGRTGRRTIDYKKLLKEYEETPFGEKDKLAEKYGITRATLTQYIYKERHSEKKAEHKGKKYSDRLVNHMVKMVKQGMSTKEIAKRTGFKSAKSVCDTIYSRTGKALKDLK